MHLPVGALLGLLGTGWWYGHMPKEEAGKQVRKQAITGSGLRHRHHFADAHLVWSAGTT